MKAALQWARMNRDISEGYFRSDRRRARRQNGLRSDGQPLQCHDMTMMCGAAHRHRRFCPDLYASRDPARVVAYVPDDPEHPIKEYASPAELVRRTDPPTALEAITRQFFSRFVNHEQRGFFFASLNSRLSRGHVACARSRQLATAMARHRHSSGRTCKLALTPIRARSVATPLSEQTEQDPQ